MSKINSAISGAATGATIGGPLGAAVGGIGGFMLGEDDNSQKELDKMMRDIDRIPLPVLKEYYPELYQQAILMNPSLDTAVNLGPSEMQGISTDPALRLAQMNALDKLTSLGKGEESLSDRAALSKIQSDVNTNLKGNQDAIMQNLAARGMSGGGSELVSRQLAAQEAANRQGQAALDVRAQAEQRALNALMQSGQLGGQMQAQDFNQASQKAQAQDAISRFNAQNLQDVQARNMNARNQANSANTANQNMILKSNVDLRNQAKQRNLDLDQMNYENQLRKRGMLNTGAIASAQNQSNQAANQDKFMGGLFESAATAYGKEQENKKKK